jgi:hypothetical protein
MLRRWVLCGLLIGMTWTIAGCSGGGDEGSKIPEGGVAAPGSPALPGANDAGIDMPKKKARR